MELFIIEDYKTSYPDLTGKKLTDALVEDLLRDHGYVGPEEPVLIERLPSGKPVLSGREDIHFSVSHTEDIFGCLIAGREAGLDLQMAGRRDVLRLARRYFTEDEVRCLEEAGGSDRQRQLFYRLWTRKEAYAKLTGRGLEAILAREPVLGRGDVRFEDLDFGNDLYGCICSLNE